MHSLKVFVSTFIHRMLGRWGPTVAAFQRPGFDPQLCYVKMCTAPVSISVTLLDQGSTATLSVGQTKRPSKPT